MAFETLQLDLLVVHSKTIDGPPRIDLNQIAGYPVWPNCIYRDIK